VTGKHLLKPRDTDQLARLIVDSDRSVRQLATACGCSPARIGQFRRGVGGNLDPDLATKLARALHTRKADLFEPVLAPKPVPVRSRSGPRPLAAERE